MLLILRCALCRAYDTTRLYRDVRIRSSVIMPNGVVHTIRNEEVFATHDGVWNLSGEKVTYVYGWRWVKAEEPAAASRASLLYPQRHHSSPSTSDILLACLFSLTSSSPSSSHHAAQGELGSMVVTNVRVVWYSDIDERFNVSIPYNQVVRAAHLICMQRAFSVPCLSLPPPLILPSIKTSVLVRRSKFGLALVLKTSKQSGSLKIGFRMDPEDRLKMVAKRIERLHRVYHTCPLYGVEHAMQSRVRWQQ